MEIVNLFEDNMLSYAGAVNQSRALPDARTGLKPIHRKILYEMYADKIKSSGKYKKCAYMVGQIIARFSEHGDAATYDALIRLGQDWIQHYPLINIHGNAGSQFGDSQAAMRYVEAKLSALAEDGMLYGLDKKNVDWIPNFTNEEEEPSTLPAIFPGLFCLPNQGMGYAAACHFVTYNLTEVAEYLQALINDSDLPQIYPDFASGGILANPQNIASIQKNGKGSVILDSKYQINDNKIIITEIPFNVAFDDIYDQIVDLCKKEEITFVSNLINNSGGGKIELVIEVNNNPEEAINVLFGKTKLRNSYPVNQVAIVNGEVKLLTFEEMGQIYIDHNTQCIQKEHVYEFGLALSRIEILEGLLIAIANLDKVIKTIRESSSPKEELAKVFPTLSEKQIKAILDMKLSRLSKLENEKIEKELKEKKKYAAYCESVINSIDKQKEILVQRLQELVKKYGDKRRTEVVQKEIKKISAGKAKEKIEEVPQDIVVAYDNSGYIKAIPVAEYKKSKNLLSEFKCTTADLILCFSSLGKVYRISAKDIGMCGQKDKGKIITTIINVEKDEKIIKVSSSIIDDKHPYLTTVTNDGKIKKSDKIELISTTRNLNGIKYIGLDNNEVFWCGETNGDYIHIGTTDGYHLAFELEDIRATGKTSKGVISIKLNEGAQVNLCELNIKPSSIEITKRNGKGKKIKC